MGRLHPVFAYTERIYYTTYVNAISIHNMNKYSILALALLRMDERGPLCYSIVTERKQPEIRNHRKFQDSHFQKEPKKARIHSFDSLQKISPKESFLVRNQMVSINWKFTSKRTL